MPRASVRKPARVARERGATWSVAPETQPKFKRVTRRQINAVVQKIVDEFKPEKIILFGSYAYGKPNIDSDVDLLVVMESNEQSTRRAIKIVHRLLDVPFPMDVLVRTPQEIQHRLAIGDFFIQEIVGMGKVLHDRRAA